MLDVIMKDKNSKTVKKGKSYTYLASKSEPKLINPYVSESSEIECLKLLQESFLSHFKVEAIDGIPTDKDMLMELYQKYFSTSEKNNSFTMRTKLKQLFKREHMSVNLHKSFMKQFVFGFNGVVKAIEKGTLFDILMIDRVLADAPILTHMREGAKKNGNGDICIASLEAGSLVAAVSSDCKNFARLLLMGIIRSDIPLSEVGQLSCDIRRRLECVPEETVTDINAMPSVAVTPAPVRVAIKRPFQYVLAADESLVAELHAAHSLVTDETIADSKMVKLDDLFSRLPKSIVYKNSITKFIRPVEQMEYRKNNKKARKAKRNQVTIVSKGVK